MRTPSSILVFCLAWLASSSWLLALPVDRELHQYAHRQWRIEEGLPQNTVRSIVQTPDGMLWVGTQGGLARFDGFDFSIVRDADGVLDRTHAYAVVVGADGELWVGTNSGELLRYRGGRFERVEGITTGQILVLRRDGDTLWLGTEDVGAVRLDADGTSRTWGLDHGIAGGVHDLALDGAGGVWVPTAGGGLHHIDADGTVREVAPDALPSPLVWSVARDGDSLWAGTTRGLIRIENGEVVERIGEDQLGEAWVRHVLVDRDGALWVGTVAGIIRGVRTADGGWRFDRQGDRRTSSPEVVWEIFEDSEGSIWWGTLGSGLHQIVAAPAVTFANRDGLDSHRPLAVLPALDGGLDVPTRGGGVLHFHDGRFTSRDEAWAAVNAWSLARDDDGGLWLATTVPSLDHVVDGRLRRRYTVADGLGRGRVLCAHVAANGDVWAATSAGLARVRDDTVTMFTKQSGLVHDSVLTIESRPDDRLWIGTRSGLSIFDGETFVNVEMDPERGLRNGSVWSVLPRADGSAWVGTFGGGLHRIEGDRVTDVVTVADGLPSNDITGLVDDRLGNLWLSTTRGLAWVSEQAIHDYLAGRLAPLPVRVLDARHGITSAEFFGGQPIGLEQEGILWFVHLGGLTRVDPRRLVDQPAPSVVVTRFGVDGEAVDSLVDQRLPQGPHTLDFAWAAATLDAPERHRFRYRLRGFETDWSEPARGRAIRYTNVGSGDYVFEVQASDDRGQFTGEISAVSMSIEPRFSESGPFFALVAGALIALGVGIQQIRVWRLARRQAELRRVADEAVASARTLSGLLPMCASCKKVRDDAGYWNQIEVYLDTHSEAELSHGLCPDCMAESWAELDREVPLV